MAIAITSDLHLGITSPRVLGELADTIESAAPEALVLAGDIGEGPGAFAECVRLFADAAPRRGFVAGNHDVWAREGFSSEELWLRRLPGLAGQHDCAPLENQIWRLADGVALVASMAWYDYSAIDPAFAHLDAETIARKKRDLNNDGVMIDWSFSDRELAARCAAGVVARLEKAQADPDVRRVIVVTHVPLFEQQILRRPENAVWGFSNAYFGHLTLGRAVERFDKVSDVVSGHTHYGRDALVERAGQAPIRTRVIGSEYGAPAWVLVE